MMIVVNGLYHCCRINCIVLQRVARVVELVQAALFIYVLHLAIVVRTAVTSFCRFVDLASQTTLNKNRSAVTGIGPDNTEPAPTSQTDPFQHKRFPL
jgi:hypothetical protein